MGVDSETLSVLLDGKLSTYSWRRLQIIALLPLSWATAFPVFIDQFVAKAVNMTGCACSVSASNATSCQACAAAGGELICPYDPTTMASDFDLMCSRNALRGLPSTFCFAGIGVGALFWGTLADALGRRPTLVCSVALMALGTIASAFAPSFELYLAAKLLIGMGSGGSPGIGSALSSELIGPTRRTWLVTELTGYVWAANCLVLALFCYLLRAVPWRQTVGWSCMPYVFLTVAFAAVLPESPHWYLKRGEHHRVERVLHYLLGKGGLSQGAAGGFCSSDYSTAGCGLCGETSQDNGSMTPSDAEETRSADDGVRPPTCATISSRPAQPDAAEACADESSAMTLAVTPPRSLGLMGICCNGRLAFRLWCQVYLWSTISLSYYAISFAAGGLSPSIYVNFALVSLPLFGSGVAAAKLMDHPRLGRRGASAAFLSIVVVAIVIGARWPVAAMATSMVGTFAAEGAFALIYLQVQELFPTAVRSSALGFSSFASRAANLLSAPLPIILGPHATLVLVGAICAVALPVALSLPETRGIPLE